MTLLDICTWIEQGTLGTFIRDSQVLFPFIESIHLVALGLFGGIVLVLDLRLCGWGLVTRDADEIEAQTRHWFWRSLGVLIVTGALLFVSEAVKCYYSAPFWIKIGCLIAAILVALTVRATAVRRGYWRSRPAVARGIGVLSILLWFGVAWGGRWIGFSG